MQFLFMYVMLGGDKGGIVYTAAGHLYGIPKGNVSNYMRHAVNAKNKMLKQNEFFMIYWSNKLYRKPPRGLIYAFQNHITFVDGTKERWLRPKDETDQSERYDRHNNVYRVTALAWADNLGIVIHFDINLIGRKHERGVYNDSDFPLRPNYILTMKKMLLKIKVFREGEGTLYYNLKRIRRRLNNQEQFKS